LTFRAFHRYQRCIEPINARCGHGLQQILDYESSLRRYTLKMNYICREQVLDGTRCPVQDSISCRRWTARRTAYSSHAKCRPYSDRPGAALFVAPASSKRRRRNKQPTVIVFIDLLTALTRSEAMTKFSKSIILDTYRYFCSYPNFLTTQCRIGGRKPSCQKSAQSIEPF